MISYTIEKLLASTQNGKVKYIMNVCKCIFKKIKEENFKSSLKIVIIGRQIIQFICIYLKH